MVKAADAGLDHVCTSDHVNYFVGAGFDGLVNAAALALAHSASPCTSACICCRCDTRRWWPTSRCWRRAGWCAASASAVRIGASRGSWGRPAYARAPHGGEPHDSAFAADRYTGHVHGEFFDLEDALILPAPHTAAAGRPELTFGRTHDP